MYFNGFQNPKLAAIRLLRSQNLCNSQEPPQQCQQCCQSVKYPTPQQTQLQSLLRYKQELESKVVHQRAKLSEIPCAIQLSKELEELEEIIQGLTKENKQRGRLVEGVVKGINATCYTDGVGDEEDLRESERLQAEYQELMRKLERVNDRNSTLVNQLTF